MFIHFFFFFSFAILLTNSLRNINGAILCLVFALVNLGVSNTVGSGPGSGAGLGVGILSKFSIEGLFLSY